MKTFESIKSDKFKKLNASMMEKTLGGRPSGDTKPVTVEKDTTGGDCATFTYTDLKPM